ncbi:MULTISPECIES: TetR/AcrR family transcriptional regulator [Bacillaceae]|uniref:TetR family transcriptional regulator n=1 Tax=Gottfriedia luciferensis TaxID=178774 RepID=A0ABX2ZLA7_9BACI|nr:MULTISPECIES: TetR/AcrR family transcriptional regulator [Bacillaceae]ODG90497.1 TetR family transcriptional regulator [Gottfriedia luciferensis]PGZ94280.1 TetR/AcrR family transcriptional regulator [Bacillus sp. AFS029533]SFD21298.1 transcriptional regulator, TetR family [Bacillus sp. UNCCL81]
MKDKTKVDPRIIRTRQLIKDAFIELLQEMDLNKITVNRIADRATVNRVTFYLHYRDIQDMMENMALEMGERLGLIMRGSTTLKSIDETDSVRLLNLLEHIAENAKFYKVVLASTKTPIFTEQLLKIITETITKRREIDSLHIKTDIQKDIIIWYGSSALIGTIVSWLRNDMPYTPQYLAKQLSLLFRIGNKIE